MKKLITLLAVFGFATSAYAADQTGSFRVIYDRTTNTTDFNDDAGDKVNNAMQRLIWAPSFKVSDAVSVHTTLVHSSAWGNNEDQVPGGQNTENDSLIVNEAYANWMINDESSVRFGRGSFTMSDGRVVSANNWEQVAKAFEGLMYSHDHEMARASLFAVRGATGAGSNNSANFYGASFDFKSLPEFLKNANFHYIMVKRDAATYPNVGALTEEDTTRMGVTVGGDTAGVDYSLTYAMYSGDLVGGTVDADASMYDFTVGYSMPDLHNLRVSVQMHSDSGDEGNAGESGTYTGFHYDTHNNAGLMDLVGYGNLTFTRVGLSADLKDDCSVGADYYMFSATEGTDTAYATNGTAIGRGAGAAADEDDIGTEMDFWFNHSYSSNFSAQIRYSTFAAGDYFAPAADDASEIYVEGTMTF